MWLLLCADDAYAISLAVTLHSTLARAQERVDATVVLNGVSQENRRRLERVAARHDAQVQWISAEKLDISHLKGDRHVSPSTYLRLFADQVLPREADRAVFLDADVLVLADVSKLYRIDLEGRAVGAVRDMVIADHGHPWAGTVGGDPGAAYFNAGVLVLDLGRWRDGIGGDLRRYAQERSGLGNFDQEALNDILWNDWRELDMVWNVQSSLLWLHFVPPHPWVVEMRRRRPTLLDEAAIVHFSGSGKPWERRSQHPFRHLWRRELFASGWFDGHVEAGRWRARLALESLAYTGLVLGGVRRSLERVDG